MRAMIVIPCLTILIALPAAAQLLNLPAKVCTPDSSCLKEDPEPILCNLFKGMLQFETAGGVVQRRVVLQDWQIANGVTAEIPHKGLLIVHLRSGALATGIGDERQEWKEGSYWSVPAGQSLIVRTARESVVLQTLDLLKMQ
jgi:hypothetical protein